MRGSTERTASKTGLPTEAGSVKQLIVRNGSAGAWRVSSFHPITLDGVVKDGQNYDHMARRQPYTLIYALEITKHLAHIDAKYDSLIHEKIEEQLLHEPGVETKNRKPLRPPAPFAAQWEIRFGPDNRFRVLYDIDEEQHAVEIVAIGEKQGNRLKIAGEEIDL